MVQEINYKGKTLLIEISEREPFWSLDANGELVSKEDNPNEVDESICPNITEQIYEGIIENIETYFKEIVDEGIPFDSYRCEEEALIDINIEGYESLDDFNIKVELQ